MHSITQGRLAIGGATLTMLSQHAYAAPARTLLAAREACNITRPDTRVYAGAGPCPLAAPRLTLRCHCDKV